MRQARLYDQPTGTHDQIFDPSRRELPDGERDQVLAFLNGGGVVLGSTMREVDKLDPSRGAVVPMSLVTDGEWIWSRALAYYTQIHGVGPESEFLAWIRDCGYRAAEPGEAQRSAAASELQALWSASAAE